MLRKLSLEGKYIISTVVVVAMVLIVNFVLYVQGYDSHSSNLMRQFTVNTQHKTELHIQQKGVTYASMLASQLFDPVYTSNLNMTYRVVNTTLSQPDVAVVHVVDNDGYIFHDGTKELSLFSSLHPQQAAIKDSLESHDVIVGNNGQRIIAVAPIEQSDVLLGAVYLEMDLSHLHQEQERNKQKIQAINIQDKQDMLMLQSFISVVCIAIGLVMAVVVGRSLTRPIKKLSQHISSTKGGNLAQIRGIHREDEIGELVHAYNSMTNDINNHHSKVEFMAYYDSLTGLPNRVKLLQAMQQRVDESQTPFSIMVLDIDDFKQVNDHFGHDLGDELVKLFSERLAESIGMYLQKSSTLPLIARLGVDQLAILLDGNHLADARTLAKSLLPTLCSSYLLDDSEVSITASIGISSYPSFSSQVEHLLSQAELAMQKAKDANNKSVVVYDSELHEQLEQRVTIERELKSAMSQLDQFELWYQPKFDLTFGHLVGAEALVRWKHPEHGYIQPDQFIPIAESSDLILTLGEHIIESAIKQGRLWQDVFGHHFHVGINLSPRQLYRQDLSGIFKRYLTTYDLPPNGVQIEVTESLLMSDTKRANRVLKQLGNLGIEIWLDDFGTGYSSLSYLQQVQFDGIKIDRTFVSGIEDDQEEVKLLEAIVSMAHSLEMKIVAEGIETQHQQDILAHLGCDVGQGYYLGKPIPASEFLASWQPDYPSSSH